MTPLSRRRRLTLAAAALALVIAAAALAGRAAWRRWSPGCVPGPASTTVCATSDMARLPNHGRVPLDSPDYDLSLGGVHLDAARNEVVGFQIILQRKASDPARLSLTVTDLKNPKGDTLPADPWIERFLAYYAWVDNAGYTWGSPTEVLPWPDFYPDALIPFEASCDPRPSTSPSQEGAADDKPGAPPTDSPEAADGAEAGAPAQAAPRAPLADFPVPTAHGANQAVWIDVTIPRDQPPGLYHGRIVVAAQGERLEIPLYVEVFGATLPDETTIQAVGEIYDPYRAEGVNPDQIGTPRWRRAAWCHQQLAHRHRAVFIERFDGAAGPDGAAGSEQPAGTDDAAGPDQPAGPDGAAGHDKLAADGADRPGGAAAGEGSGAGKGKTDEAWAAYVEAFGPALDGRLFTPEFGYRGPGQGVPVSVWRTPWPQGYNGSLAGPLPDEELEALKGRAAAWAALVEAQGWDRTSWFAYIFDEVDGPTDHGAGFEAADPAHDAAIAMTHAQMARVQRALDEGSPERRIDLMWTSHSNPTIWSGKEGLDLVGVVRLWAPNASAADVPFLAARREAGERAWFYHDGHPSVGAHAVNASGVEMRTWGVITARYRLDGHLMWAVNLSDPENPYNKPSYKNSDDRFGNGAMLYPGAMLPTIGFQALDEPVPSARLKAWRRGLQDAELIALARAAAGDAAVDPLVERMIPRALSEGQGRAAWPSDPAAWLDFHRALLRLASPP